MSREKIATYAATVGISYVGHMSDLHNQAQCRTVQISVDELTRLKRTVERYKGGIARQKREIKRLRAIVEHLDE